MKRRDSVPPVALEDLESPGVSRRDFLKISTIAATVPIVVSPKTVMAAGRSAHLRSGEGSDHPDGER